MKLFVLGIIASVAVPLSSFAWNNHEVESIAVVADPIPTPIREEVIPTPTPTVEPVVEPEPVPVVQPAPAPAPVTYAPITLADLANFVPQSASLTSQPRGWTVVNLNTNFIAGASTHVVGGSLFGRSAEVRFTPHGYDWNYGDGGAQTTSVSGARWDALGLREFSPTSPSHIYGSEGSFTTTVSARYGAEYRVGGGAWIPASGEVSSSATTTVVIVQSADTVLAARDCTAGRTAPGC